MEKVINVAQRVLLIKLGNKITKEYSEKIIGSTMKRLTKNKYDKMFFGVCSGLANWLNTDATLVRIVFVVGSFLSGSLLFWIYVMLAIILPSE